MERQKVTEADNLRTLFLSTFFLDFFLSSRAQDVKPKASSGNQAGEEGSNDANWTFGLVADFCEVDAVRWVVARMRLVMEDTVRSLL